MFTLSDKSQFQAQAIKQEKHKLARAHQEIMQWISNQFGVNALDFSCETRKDSKGNGQQLVHLILETVEDVKKMQASQPGATLVTERFLNYFKSADPDNHKSDALKSNVFPPGTNPFPEIIVTYRPLKELTGDVMKEMLKDEQEAILKTFESVWTMSVNVIFYYSDEQVNANMTTGISAKIDNELGTAAIKYGFDTGSPYRFDSKESFDRDYDGNWYYYWK